MAPRKRKENTKMGKARKQQDSSKNERSKQKKMRKHRQDETRMGNWKQQQGNDAQWEDRENREEILESVKITENDNKRTIPIQTTEGCYEATLTEDNPNNCQIQKQLGLTRYSIPQPPEMMRNIPMYRATTKLQHGQVLKFDTRKPDPGRRLWNRQENK